MEEGREDREAGCVGLRSSKKLNFVLSVKGNHRDHRGSDVI